jgi:hypothetical protein
MTTTAASTAAPRRIRFRLAGFLFTYCRETAKARVRIDMWREDPETNERHWITVATTAPDRKSARAVALALVAWVRWCDVGPKNNTQSQAVAESFALLRERLANRLPNATGQVTARPATKVTPKGGAGDNRAAAA